MKNILTLSIAMLAMGTAAHARKKPVVQPLTASNQRVMHLRIMDMLLHHADMGTAQKTTMLKQRVVAMSNWDQAGTPSLADSAICGYTSNTRGSSFNYNMMAYYTSYPSLNNLSLEYVAGNPERIDVKADSILRYSNNGTGLTLGEKQLFSYNSANKIVDYYDNDYTSTPAYEDRYIHKYDAQGRLIYRLNISDGDTSSREFFTYNAQGKVLMDSLEQYDGVNIWSPAFKIAYVYDASGNNPASISMLADMTGNGTLVPFLSYTNTFYSNNTIKTSQFGINQSGQGIEPIYIDSFGYASGITAYFNYLQEKIYDNNTAAWELSYRQSRHINAQSLPDTVNAETWDGTQWQPYGKNVYTYNSSNNPVTDKMYTTNTTPDNITTYYYEQYNDPTSVTNTPAVAQDIRLYPNPTSGNINIRWSNAVAGAPVTISIAGMNGQLVYSESLRWNQAEQQVSLGQLQPGVYALVITDQNGRQVFHQNIVKQ